MNGPSSFAGPRASQVVGKAPLLESSGPTRRAPTGSTAGSEDFPAQAPSPRPLRCPGVQVASRALKLLPAAEVAKKVTAAPAQVPKQPRWSPVGLTSNLSASQVRTSTANITSLGKQHQTEYLLMGREKERNGRLEHVQFFFF